MIHLRLGKKTQKTRLGCRRVELSPQEREIRGQNKVAGRARLRPISKKGRVRNKNLKAKLEVILEIQERLYGRTMCEAMRGHDGWKHRCPALDGRDEQLVLDHVSGRNNENADRYANLQVLGSWCNFQKGSVRGLDFRPKEMVAAMLELDKQ